MSSLIAANTEQSRRHRDCFYCCCNPTSANAASRGRFHDQRNMNRRVVDKKPVFLLTVLAERLTVIAQNHDETLVDKSCDCLSNWTELAQFVIRVCDLSVVGRYRDTAIEMVRADHTDCAGRTNEATRKKDASESS